MIFNTENSINVALYFAMGHKITIYCIVYNNVRQGATWLFMGATWYLPAGCPMGNLIFPGVVKACHQCPWLLWYTISVRISSWFVTSFLSDIFMRFSWWRHQMETFSALLALCAGNSPVPVNSPHKGQWCGALMFSLICTWINAWVNNPEALDLRRHRAHYDVIVMESWFPMYWT